MRCSAAGLDPRTQPFEYITLQGKLTLYAKKGAADQIASNNSLSTQIISKHIDDYISVQVRVSDPSGRFTEDIGLVPTPKQTGDIYANAVLKAVSKAKRRAILSHCGLGMLDETEVESIPGAQPIPEPIDFHAADTLLYDAYQDMLKDGEKLGIERRPLPLNADERTIKKYLDGLSQAISRRKAKLENPEPPQQETNYGLDPEGGLEPVSEAELVDDNAPATEEQSQRWVNACDLARESDIEVPPAWPALITASDAEGRIALLEQQIRDKEEAEYQAA
jgi:hypothetical protein